ncbi:MAG: sigma-70 family RNA polymerase sigma factor [Elusimicrobia bacterium]|nr:sigma-70 family RNA polymerase sigma factor [Elusimicrobiota bacterium]
MTSNPTEEAEELDLIRAAQAGRRSAFEALVRRHHVRIIQLCGSLLGNQAEAEDAAQEVFLKAYVSLTRFEGDAAFGTWLHRIAVNHCLDLLRKRARRKTDSLDELVEREGRAIEAADLAARLLATLPEEQRVAITLRETQGLNYEEIAKVMDCTVDSVKGRLKRARETLEKSLRHFLSAGGV